MILGNIYAIITIHLFKKNVYNIVHLINEFFLCFSPLNNPFIVVLFSALCLICRL